MESTKTVAATNVIVSEKKNYTPKSYEKQKLDNTNKYILRFPVFYFYSQQQK